MFRNTLLLLFAAAVLACGASVLTIATAESPPENIHTFDLAVIGTVRVPESWRVDNIAPDKVLVGPDAGKTELLFRKLQAGEFDNVWSYLRSIARQHGLPPYPRKIDKEQLEKVHADEGLFIHGTVPLKPPTDKRDISDAPVQRSSRYWMFVLYRKGTDWFALEAWTDELSRGATTLYKIQRSWRLKD